MSTHAIFDGQSADGNGADVQLNDFSTWMIQMSGSIGGGTMTLQIKKEGTSTYVTIDGSDKTALVAFGIVVPRGTTVRGVLSGSTTPDLSVEAVSIKP